MNREEALQAAWTLSNRYPGKRSAILSKLEDYNLTVDDFSRYDSTMVATRELKLFESRAEKLKDIPGFSQTENISDTEILRVFEARDDLNERKANIDKPPTEAEWYKAGLTAEERIAKLRPAYETKMAEEWEQLENPLPFMFEPLTGLMQYGTEIAAGWTDFTPGLAGDFGERLHERGAFTSYNPFTGFGAWDIAEFKVNPDTGQRGLSPDLLAMEEELNELYGTKGTYEEQMIEGGYRDVYSVEEELASLNQIIMENKLLDPRLLGETQ